MTKDAAHPSKAKLRVLLIGPLPPAVGGDTRLFSFLTSDLRKVPGLEVQVISTSRGTHSNSALHNIIIIALAQTFSRVVVKAPFADVISFHASCRGMVTFGPILYVIARVLRKRLICRLFGGSFDSYYAAQNPVLRGIVRHTVLASDKCLFQTRRLVEYFSKLANGRAVWFSNYIRLDAAANRRASPAEHTRCERLIFLGHMWVTKGIDVMLEAGPQLPARVTIDLYGPWKSTHELSLSRVVAVV